MFQCRAGSRQSEEVASAAVRRVDRDASDGSGYYAFVKFYSAIDTSRALKELGGRLYWRGQHAKVVLGEIVLEGAKCKCSGVDGDGGQHATCECCTGRTMSRGGSQGLHIL